MQRLIMVPALITLGVTLLRLVGELNGWSRVLFNPEAGGGGAVIGIAWLVPIFGIYLALKLSSSGAAVSAGKTVLYSLLGLAAFAAVFGVATFLFGVDPNQPTVGALVAIIGGAIAALAVTYFGTPTLSKTLLAYGLSARIPVTIVMLLAMMGNWGTHYDAAPPGFPEMGLIAKWIAIGVVPQLTIWIAYTIVFGAFFGGIALAVTRRKPALQTA